MSVETDTQPLDVDKGHLLPADYRDGRLRTFVLVDADLEPVGEGAVFTDGRVVVCRQHGQKLERYRTLDTLVMECAGREGWIWSPAGATGARRFIFRRGVDSTGFSGPGIAVEGVEFTGGACVLRWLGPVSSLVEWGSVQEAITVHGHAGDTVIDWLDEA